VRRDVALSLGFEHVAACVDRADERSALSGVTRCWLARVGQRGDFALRLRPTGVDEDTHRVLVVDVVREARWYIGVGDVLRKRLLARHGGHARLYRRFDRAEYVLVLLRGASAVCQGARHTTEAVPEALIDRASDAPYKGKELMLPRWYRWG